MHELRSTILTGDTKPDSPVARKSRAKGGAASLGGLAKIPIKREAARVTDQRLEDRHFGIVERSTIVFRRRRHEVDVVNVSSRGAMIVAPIEPRIGEKIDIQFADSNRTRCVVRWIREGRIGLEFVDETIFWETGGQGPVFRYEAPEPAASPVHVAVDREPRQTLLRAGTLYWSGISIPVRLRNISEGGARVESGRPLCAGAEVELDLGNGQFAVAEVRWSKDGQVGLRFAEAFDIDSLAPAQAQACDERPPDLLKPAYLETELQPDSPWAARFERLSLTDLKQVGREG